MIGLVALNVSQIKKPILKCHNIYNIYNDFTRYDYFITFLPSARESIDGLQFFYCLNITYSIFVCNISDLHLKVNLKDFIFTLLRF